MKYFSLQEVLVAIPAALFLGIVGAFAYRLSAAAFMCALNLLKIKDYIKAKTGKSRFAFGKEDYMSFSKRKAGFILSEILGFAFSAGSGIILSLALYVLSDGIPRIYIFISVIFGFYMAMKIFEKPFVYFCSGIANTVFRALFFITYLISYLPIKIILKKKRGKRRNTTIKKNPGLP